VYEGDGKCDMQEKVSFDFYYRRKLANAHEVLANDPFVNSIESGCK
jgi:hypothetical protein